MKKYLFIGSCLLFLSLSSTAFALSKNMATGHSKQNQMLSMAGMGDAPEAMQKSDPKQEPQKSDRKGAGKNQNTMGMGASTGSGMENTHLEPTIRSSTPIKKDHPAEIILKVTKDGKLVDNATPFLTVKSFFGPDEMSDEHGAAGMTKAEDLKGTRIASGTYRFTWTPESDGRTILTFMVGGAQATMPIDVQAPLPNIFFLSSFALFVIASLSYSTHLRTRSTREVAAHEPA